MTWAEYRKKNSIGEDKYNIEWSEDYGFRHFETIAKKRALKSAELVSELTKNKGFNTVIYQTRKQSGITRNHSVLIYVK